MVFGKPFFFYGGIGANKDGTQPHIKFGVLSNHTNCVSDNRIRVVNDLVLVKLFRQLIIIIRLF